MGLIIWELIFLRLGGNTKLNQCEIEFLNLCFTGSPKGDIIVCKPRAHELLQLQYFEGLHYPKLLQRQYNLEHEYGIKLTEVAEYYQRQFRAPEMHNNQKISNRGFDLVPFSSRLQFKKKKKLVESDPNYLEFLKMIK